MCLPAPPAVCRSDETAPQPPLRPQGTGPEGNHSARGKGRPPLAPGQAEGPLREEPRRAHRRPPPSGGSTGADPRARTPDAGQAAVHALEVPGSCLLPGLTAKAGPRQEANSGTNPKLPVLHTLLFYYGKGGNATSSTTTSKIYPKNNSVQNRSVSEFKKKERKKPLHEL